MIVGTILLDPFDRYVDEEGNLPSPRPIFDKDLLRELVKGEIISNEGFELLPPSIANVAKDITSKREPTVPITISEIDALSDILIVVRTTKAISGNRTFRFDNFKMIVKQPSLEIWVRKNRR